MNDSFVVFLYYRDVNGSSPSYEKRLVAGWPTRSHHVNSTATSTFRPSPYVFFGDVEQNLIIYIVIYDSKKKKIHYAVEETI